MSPTDEPRGDARRFFLLRTPDEGAPELDPAEARHALRVVRVRAGDALTGLDGRGGAWPLEVASVARDRLELRATGPVRVTPAPGAPGAPLPSIEVVSAIPRAGRAEDMIDRLAQLGVARWRAWIPARAAAGARELKPARRERLVRRAREACKQSGRTWPLAIGEPTSTDELCARGLGPALGWLDPDAPQGLADWLRTRRDARAPDAIALAIGPEGGLTDDERRALRDAGASPLGLGPHVLRIETAAEAAAAIVAHLTWSAPPA